MTKRAMLEELLTARRIRGLIEIERRTADDARRSADMHLRAAEACETAAAIMQERLDRLEDVTGLERETGADVELGEPIVGDAFLSEEALEAERIRRAVRLAEASPAKRLEVYDVERAFPGDSPPCVGAEARRLASAGAAGEVEL